MIATPLEAQLVERIGATLPGIELLYDAALLPAPRYPSDHRGAPDFARDDAGQARWNQMLAAADVVYGVPGDTGPALAAAIPHAPALRWLQATSAGAGEQIRAANLGTADLARITFTTAGGIHGGMLAEFAFYGLLALRKDSARLARIRSGRTWDHFAMGELAGATIAVIGMGGIGQAVARRAQAFDMRVLGVTRTGEAQPAADAMFAIADIRQAMRGADVIVVTLPGTDTTRGLIDRAAIAEWGAQTIFINLGRGSIVDQTALIDALLSEKIGGAVLDVFTPEPLPSDNPLWTLPNVIFSPHTAALSVRENERIVDLFCDNLRRFVAGEQLRNVVNVIEFY